MIMEEVLKKVTVLFFLLITFIAIDLLGADTAAIFPIGAKERDEWTVAKDVDRSVETSLKKIKGVKAISFKELLSKNDRIKLNKCKAEMDCHKDVSKNVTKKVDFFLFSKLKITEKNEVVFYTYLFDRKYNKLEQGKRNFDEFATPENIAKGVIAEWNDLLGKHVSASEDVEEDEDESAFVEDDRTEDTGTLTKSSGSRVEDIIMEGFKLYAEGDLKAAASTFSKAASRDVVAKKLYNDVSEIDKYITRAAASIKGKNYEEAIPIIARAEKLDDEIKGLGVKYRAYYNENIERVSYLEPTAKDSQIVDVIHRKYAKTTENARKEKVTAMTNIEKWLNTQILERESKLKQFETDSLAQAELEKKEYGELTNRIKTLKYQWEKDDSELEQKIVALENKLTLFEQKEKGVVKVSTEGDEKARLAELSEVDKKYTELLNKLKKEKEDYYNKQKDSLDSGSKKTEADVVKLEEKKKVNVAKIADIDKSISSEMDKFDLEEKKYLGGNEEVKMKNEDEDRKFKVEVEKEYQAKFDDLNKKLQEFDQQESEKRKEMEVFDKAIEEYMTKNVEAMSKFQEEQDKERAAIDTEYKTKKETASADAEKKFNEEKEKLVAEKTALDAKIAEKETPALKKQLASLEKKIAAFDAGKETFVADIIMKVDMEYEAKVSPLDAKLAAKNAELQKDNNTFRNAKLAEKKKAQGDFDNFLKRKDLFKKSIDNQVAIAQKERDNKIEARSKDRGRLSSSWDDAKQQRQKALDLKLKNSRDTKDRLVKENEKIDADIAAINTKWGTASDDLRVKYQSDSEKFETSWKTRFEKTENEYKEKKEAVETKYAQQQISEKEAQKQQKIKWEEEIQSLNEEKQRRKDARTKILEDEKSNWTVKKEDWVKAEEKRKADKAQFIKDMKDLNTEDRKEAAKRKKDADTKFDENTKAIYQKEMDEISEKFKEEYKTTKTREIVGVKTSTDISSLKADALSKNGLIRLQNKDILGARRLFAEALFIDKTNQIAVDGMKSISDTAKSMYWEAYGMKDGNKAKAKEIFILLTKTLMPSNEYFIKAKVALDELN
mgnify:CR=1 FL=1